MGWLRSAGLTGPGVLARSSRYGGSTRRDYRTGVRARPRRAYWSLALAIRGNANGPNELGGRPMRRMARLVLITAAIVTFVGATPVAAAATTSVTITATTTFDDLADTFTADGLPDCSTGIVENGPAHVEFTRHHGTFTGFKVFSCDGSDTGFVLRLNARFGDSGSIGAWAVVDAWGSLEGMQGAGGLTGEPIPGVEGILDTYVGEVVL